MGSVIVITIDGRFNACCQMLARMLKYFKEMGMRKILTAGIFLTILLHLFDSKN